jgi:hypothetical protein
MDDTLSTFLASSFLASSLASSFSIFSLAAISPPSFCLFVFSFSFLSFFLSFFLSLLLSYDFEGEFMSEKMGFYYDVRKYMVCVYLCNWASKFPLDLEFLHSSVTA